MTRLQHRRDAMPRSLRRSRRKSSVQVAVAAWECDEVPESSNKGPGAAAFSRVRCGQGRVAADEKIVLQRESTSRPPG